MKKTWIVVAIFLLLGALPIPWSTALAAQDGYYSLSEVTHAWDGTDASRTKAVTGDYDYTYGDEASITYNLPWSFAFYGQSYSQITVDTNGNVWFGATGSAHSFNLASNGRGPVIAAWNNDLSSYYYGGVFIQHKTNPERVVIEWQTETYTEEGYSRPDNFEIILYQGGNARIDYKTFTTSGGKDFGSGTSRNDGTNYLSITAGYAGAHTLALRSFSVLPIGSAVPPTTSVAPPSESFGTVYLTTGSVLHDFVLTNNGTSELSIGTAYLAGDNASEFQITSDTCSGSTRLPSASCTIQVRLAPVTAGIKTANLTIPSNDPSSPKTIPLNGMGSLPALTVTKTGSGTGTVTSSPAGISCGSTCSGIFAVGTPVTLTAAQGSGAIFTGWSGGGCSGIGDCIITISADTTVTANFEQAVNFVAIPTTAPHPAVINFTDLTQQATAWQWSFGDGATSTARNPSHLYRAPGVYTVSLTVTTPNGNNTYTKPDYINITPCQNPVARIVGKSSYATIQAAYDAAVDGDTIKALGIQTTESLSLNRSVSVTIDGGYICDYSSNPDMTVLQGAASVNGGTVNMKNIHLQQ